LLICYVLVGYSAHMPFDDFLREFQILQPCGKKCQAGSKKVTVVLVHVFSCVIYTTSALF